MSAYPDISLFIGGEFRKTSDVIPVVNPADETVIGAVPVAIEQDLEDALEAASSAFKVWSTMSARERGSILMHAAVLMRERVETIAYANTLDMGKPLVQSRQEVIRGGMIMEWDAAEGQRAYGRVIPGVIGHNTTTYRQPIGPVSAYSTWNFPIATAVRRISSALAGGCTVILKASEETPSGAYHVARIFQDAGLPDGALNLVFGDAPMISSRLIPDDRIRLVTFTGSTAIGIHLTELAAGTMTPVVMELGGHAPVLVCDDVDPVQLGEMSAIRKYRNSGQVCTSPTRFYVNEENYQVFADQFVEQAQKTIVGDGFDPKTEMGPLLHERRMEAMSVFVEDAVAKGAELRLGGTRIGNKGHFFAPTVLANVPDDAKIMHEEPFGPIAILNTMSSLEHGIQEANKLPFGLAAYGFTNSAVNVDQMTRQVEVGQLSINTFETSQPETPFGGVKSSGMGREGGAEGLHFYSAVKNVSFRPVIG